MNEGKITVYCGKGETAAALGYAMQSAGRGRSAIVIQFLKGRNEEEMAFLKRLEPEVKVFRVAKSEKDFSELSAQMQQGEGMNIRNWLNFAKKVLVTEECSLLVLDGFLGLLDNGMASEEDLEALMRAKSEDTELMLTGRSMSAALRKYAGTAYEILEHSLDGRPGE